MSDAIDTLARAALSSLNAAGFDAALVVRDSENVLIASVPDSRRKWADVALKSFTSLPLTDAGGRARYALFPAVPEDADPYRRTVRFRVTGDDVPPKWADQVISHNVRIIPGDTTEADIPAGLSITVFGTPARAADIAVIALT
ncbi:hypothetical protein [Streptomyces sp. 11x1]|uniref:hypothetical protein n=1 Tax=Streptomyces sp. 11x1 TaxID=3038642 RepID=UPI00292D8EA7|nr:hypothetical protein [Streptomyces sp. 11x1]WNZ14907.1 hypothetical protein P8T65_46575 [Streptomyces sp. 11x1]